MLYSLGLLTAGLALSAGFAATLSAAPFSGQRAVDSASPFVRARNVVACVPATAPSKAKSFVQTEMRAAAMKLHTKDQSREGEQKAQKPVVKWEPGREEYLQFLVDSREVYSAFEEIVSNNEEVASYANSGLERTDALNLDIEWFKEQGLVEPAVGVKGKEYAAKLRQMAADAEWEPFSCHFYNFYFAHTAGGRMIGKMMSEKLLDGRTLEFYQWGGAEPKEELLPTLRAKIDAKAAEWTREQKDACLAETAASFKGGGGLLTYLREPGPQ